MTAPIAERLRALADSMNEPLFGADTNSQTFGIRMVVLPALKSMQSELHAIVEECERIAGEMRHENYKWDMNVSDWADALAGRSK